MANADDAGSIQNASHAADAGLTNKCKADGGNAAVAQCPVKVTVKITCSPPVACPGHPHPITAVGTPSGGDYTWTVSGAELVDNSGNPLSSGDAVYLRSFQADDSTGTIPEKKATVSVTYTHPQGTAKDSTPVTIHKIEFKVTNNESVTFTDLEVKEDPGEMGSQGGVWIESKDPNVPTMNIDPKVTIKLDESCPRKKDCASNHRVGWIQDVTSWNKSVSYRHQTCTATFIVKPPVRDSVGGLADDDFPFYTAPLPFDSYTENDFERERNTLTVNHSDSPGWPASWSDPNPPKKAIDNSLVQLLFQQNFTAWLVVQNVEWSGHDLKGSFAFQMHFDWSVDHVVTVDTTLSMGQRCRPRSSTPQSRTLGKGKGSSAPSLTSMTASSKEAFKMKCTPT